MPSKTARSRKAKPARKAPKANPVRVVKAIVKAKGLGKRDSALYRRLLQEERARPSDAQIRAGRFPQRNQVARDGPYRFRANPVRRRSFNHGSVSRHEHRGGDGWHAGQAAEDLSRTRRHMSPL